MDIWQKRGGGGGDHILHKSNTFSDDNVKIVELFDNKIKNFVIFNRFIHYRSQIGEFLHGLVSISTKNSF